MAPTPNPPLATCVVGAGPAGLLYCLVASIMRARLGLHDIWPIALVDKRATYERTHRLRIDSDPYLAMQRELDHPLFDELIGFLDEQQFRPAANDLEATLLELVTRMGIAKSRAAAGDGPDELDLEQLREAMRLQGVVGQDTQLLVVGADSVKSATRALAAPGLASTERVHQTVVRLRLDGEALPGRLNRVQQFKLAKLVSSALDYRSNPNGFAEVDLFLSPEEHEAVMALGARPNSPIVLSEELVRSLDTPLFSQIARYLMGNLGSEGCRVSVYSTFRLEHRYGEQVAFVLPQIHTSVWLVGDAAVSLPFFRGMACLMKSVQALAHVHAGLASRTCVGDSMADACRRYDAAVTQIRQREVRTVEARARGIRVARELVRVSSLAPFPIQTWLLSVGPLVRPPGRVTRRLVLTMVVATLAAFLAISSPQLGAVGLLSVPLQIAAGFLYRSGLDDPSGPNPWISRFCRLQMFVLILAGFVVAFVNPFDSGVWIRLGALVGWFVLGVVFVAGMYFAERKGLAALH